MTKKPFDVWVVIEQDYEEIAAAFDSEATADEYAARKNAALASPFNPFYVEKVRVNSGELE